MSPYDWLIRRLDAFIRRYYLNQVIRGVLVLACGLLAYVLVVSLGEYLLFLPVWVRLSLWVIFLVSLVAALAGWIVLPLLRMARLGQRIGYDQAARIIGRHFPQIDDRLINMLQLRDQQPLDKDSQSLIEAAIEQNARKMMVFPIHRAVDFSVNRRLLPYLLPLLLVFLLILFWQPRVFTEASERLLAPTTVFEKPAPFEFLVYPDSLRAIRGEDFRIQVQTRGKKRPMDMILDIRGEQIAMIPDSQGFHYTFRQVGESLDFRLLGSGYPSRPYHLEVVSRPAFSDLSLQLEFPAYTGRAPETQTALTDLQVPEGTRWSLRFQAQHADRAGWAVGEDQWVPLEKKQHHYLDQGRFLRDSLYVLELESQGHGLTEAYPMEVRVIRDQHPQLEVRDYRDSLSGRQILIKGTAGDDYGLSRGESVFEIFAEAPEPLRTERRPLNLHSGLVSPFDYYVDLDQFQLEPGQKLIFYVVVWDNDGVNGPKSTRSAAMSYHMLDAHQLDSAIQENSQQAGASLSQGARQNQEMRQSLESLSTEMLQTARMDWEQQQSLQTLARIQEQMRANLEKARRHLEEQIQQTRQREYSEDLSEKQSQVKEQLDQLIDKELAAQMERLQELMKQLQKEQAFEAMEEMKQENRLFEMDMKRIQALLEQLEQQFRLEELGRKLEHLAKEQDSLRNSSAEKPAEGKERSEAQEALRRDLEKALKEELDQARKAAEEKQNFRQEDQLSETGKKGEQAAEQMKEAEKKLSQGDSKGAAPAQSKASENLRQMAASLQSMAAGMDAQQIQIDIQATRMILSNLIRVSFDQEDLMEAVRSTPISSSRFLENMKKQSHLRQQSRMIRDSLFVLSQRVAQLAPTVNKETTELEFALSSSLARLEERQLSEALKHQQYAMMHTNNLALMLNELLANLLQMQAQAQNQPGAAGACSKPGGKNPKAGAGDQLSDIITEQEDLGNAMEQMQQSRRSGSSASQGSQSTDSPSQGEGQEQGETGGEGESEALARMAARQAELRRKLAELSRQLNSQGMGQGEMLQEIMKRMDQQETDLVNREIFRSQFLARQKEILTRLLEAEKAVRDQEYSDQRSGQAARDQGAVMPPELERYLKDRQNIQEAYRSLPASLKPYYRKMVEDYYRLIGPSAGENPRIP